MFKLKNTTNTPKVELDYVSGKLKIEGRSYSEYPDMFYKGLEYEIKKIQTEKLDVIFDFDYFNTSSAKCIIVFLKYIKKIFGIDNIHVNWIYEKDDNDILEVGEDYADLTGIPFQFTVKIL